MFDRVLNTPLQLANTCLKSIIQNTATASMNVAVPFLLLTLNKYVTTESCERCHLVIWKPSLIFHRFIYYSCGWYLEENSYRANIYLFKVNNRNARKRCEIFWKLTTKTPERCHWRRFAVFIFNFEHISHLCPVFLLLTLNR